MNIHKPLNILVFKPRAKHGSYVKYMFLVLSILILHYLGSDDVWNDCSTVTFYAVCERERQTNAGLILALIPMLFASSRFHKFQV